MSKEELFGKVGTKALEYLNSAEMFAKTEVPEYLKEVIKYYSYSAYISIGFSVLLLGLGVFFSWLFSKILKEDDKNDGLVPLLFLIIGLFISAPTLFFKNIDTAIKTTVAPRVFLVDYFRGKE